jgi:ankyrin repeat protein
VWGAIIKGNVEEVKQCLTLGEDVNLRGLANMTPLHRAAQNGRKEMVELLIENGADINAMTDSGETPLDWAINRRHVELYPQIRKHGGKTSEELKAAGN